MNSAAALMRLILSPRRPAISNQGSLLRLLVHVCLIAARALDSRVAEAIHFDSNTMGGLLGSFKNRTSY